MVNGGRQYGGIGNDGADVDGILVGLVVIMHVVMLMMLVLLIP